MYCNNNAYWAPLLRPLFDAMEDTKNAANFGTLSMKTDIIEDENAYTLLVDLPGVAKENVSLAYEDNTLTLKVKTDAETGEIKYVRRERFAGEASRSFYIEGIDEKAIGAKLENGVLAIHLPKIKEEKKAHIVEIN
ncbi:MAG: Hsp20/alpha crystallin family protein [Bacilli bacterium]|nr:Hsp20/alpha crystallin family protein [Bacilli bacterium]MBQ9457474.1 Hsp20/alpha crystallin family protein [Bacilli bacterium]